ncbi:NK1 transcription factor-related protein 1-like [Maniola hyperantus]|uniref:NK1 transcription factor-related protein 1-like n=1 Tax=Aphantopus hyperantus TaxID=2795564 RepID=UPI00374A11FB
MDEIKSESIQSAEMEIQNEVKIDKPEPKLPFSIDSLLADKFVSDNNEATTSDDLVYNKEQDNQDDVDSSCSEQLDVESSTAGDAQEFLEAKSTEYPSGSCSSRGKRARTAFSAQQIKSLEAEFEKNRYLSVAARGRLARQLRLTETQVKLSVLRRFVQLSRQEGQNSVQRATDQELGGRVREEQIPVRSSARTTGEAATTYRDSDKNMVPKSADKMEKEIHERRRNPSSTILQ